MDLLGSIVVVQNASTNNLSTATPFSIPAKYTDVLIVTPSGSSVTYKVRVGGGGLTFLSDANQFSIPELTSTQIKTPNNSPDATMVAIWGTGGGGTCRVFGLYGKAQS